MTNAVLIQRVGDVLTVLYTGWNAPYWWSPECQPKQFGENFVNKMHHKFWSAFVGYLYILDQINARRWNI